MRPYVVFGSNDDGESLVPLGEFEAADHDAAKKLARDAGRRGAIGNYESYGSCPVGNWSFGKLSVKEVVDIEEIPLPYPNVHQLTVHDAIVEAREALEE